MGTHKSVFCKRFARLRQSDSLLCSTGSARKPGLIIYGKQCSRINTMFHRKNIYNIFIVHIQRVPQKASFLNCIMRALPCKDIKNYNYKNKTRFSCKSLCFCFQNMVENSSIVVHVSRSTPHVETFVCEK